jgi:hypothetical protein
MPRILTLLIFGCLYSSYTFGQCSAREYYLDSDGDGVGTDLFDVRDIDQAVIDFNDARDGATVLYGNIAYGCSKPEGYAYSPGDCDDNNEYATRTVYWFTDEDVDGTYGTKHYGCGYPSEDYRTYQDDCDDDDPNVKSERTFYRDADGDGVPGTPVSACSQGSYFTSGGDCDDNNASIKTGTRWYYDSDGDGVGGSSSQIACTSPGSKYVTTGGMNAMTMTLKYEKIFGTWTMTATVMVTAALPNTVVTNPREVG